MREGTVILYIFLGFSWFVVLCSIVCLTIDFVRELWIKEKNDDCNLVIFYFVHIILSVLLILVTLALLGEGEIYTLWDVIWKIVIFFLTSLTSLLFVRIMCLTVIVWRMMSGGLCQRLYQTTVAIRLVLARDRKVSQVVVRMIGEGDMSPYRDGNTVQDLLDEIRKIYKDTMPQS